MSAVDVLAYLQALEREIPASSNFASRRAEARQARAAVAELIEAAAEVDKLSRGIGDWSDESNVEKAVLRQRAALANIGAAP